MYPNFIWMRHCIQGYWLIFSHIHRHVIQGYWFIFSHIHRHVTRGEEGGLVCFGKKYPDSVHPWIKFFFQNVVLRVSRRKKCFPAGTFFLVFLKKCLSSAIVPRNLPFREKYLAAHLHSDIIFLAERYILNVWQNSEYVSVSITAQYFVQWPYAELCLFKYMQVYSSILNIKDYSRILKHY